MVLWETYFLNKLMTYCDHKGTDKIRDKSLNTFKVSDISSRLGPARYISMPGHVLVKQ